MFLKGVYMKTTNEPVSIIDRSLGLLRVFTNENIFLIEKESVILNGRELRPNSKTTLDNFFNGEVEYLGTYKGYLQFKIGSDSNLFNDNIWCNEFKKITDTRIMTIYQAGTARDYNFKNGNWK
jgi:hypothetical protein